MTLKAKRLIALVVVAVILLVVILTVVLLHLGRVWKFYGIYDKKDGSYEYTLGIYKDNTYELIVTCDGKTQVTREGKLSHKSVIREIRVVVYHTRAVKNAEQH